MAFFVGYRHGYHDGYQKNRFFPCCVLLPLRTNQGANHRSVNPLGCYTSCYSAGNEKARHMAGLRSGGGMGSVHRHVTSGHQVHGQAGHATMAAPLPGGYAHGAAPMVTLGCAI